MADRNFVLAISAGALSHSVENIGRQLLALDGRGVYSEGRQMESLLSDVLMGIRDDLLLKTNLREDELEQLLRDQLGRDFKHCKIEWIGTSG